MLRRKLATLIAVQLTLAASNGLAQEPRCRTYQPQNVQVCTTRVPGEHVECHIWNLTTGSMNICTCPLEHPCGTDFADEPSCTCGGISLANKSFVNSAPIAHSTVAPVETGFVPQTFSLGYNSAVPSPCVSGVTLPEITSISIPLNAAPLAASFGATTEFPRAVNSSFGSAVVIASEANKTLFNESAFVFTNDRDCYWQGQQYSAGGGSYQHGDEIECAATNSKSRPRMCWKRVQLRCINFPWRDACVD